jgi:pimeloyl-ACP methyl ester carboxylesterase
LSPFGECFWHENHETFDKKNMRTQDRDDENKNPARDRERERVVLVHGIWMTGLEMRWLGWRLARCGFLPGRFHYLSTRRTPEENARKLGKYLQGLDVDRLHLVGHSLGGVVLLHLFEQFPDLPPGRVVVMGSPLLGSGVARRMHRSPWLRPVLGRSIERGLLGDAPSWSGDRELGVIAGSHSVGVGRLLGGLEQPSDGTVAVAETRFPGADAVQVIETSHTGMIFSRSVAREVCHFLRHGCFSGHQ